MHRTLAVALLLGMPASVSAQLTDVTDSTPAHSRSKRFDVGLLFDYMHPEGDFGRFVKRGLGGSLQGRIPLDRRGQVLVGVDLDLVTYGSTTKTVQLSPTIPGLFADVTTLNNITTIGIPLRVELTRGRLRPYVTGSVGLAVFYTETSASGTSSGGDFGTSTNFHDTKFNWSGGGGLSLRVSSSAKHRVFLDFGVRHLANGTVEYLNQDSITDGGGGTTIITPIRSEANFTLYQVGLTVRSR